MLRILNPNIKIFKIHKNWPSRYKCFYSTCRSTFEALIGWLTCLRKSLLKRPPRGGGGGRSSIRSGGVSPSSLNTFSSLEQSISIIWKRNVKMPGWVEKHKTTSNCVQNTQYVHIANTTIYSFFFFSKLNIECHPALIQTSKRKKNLRSLSELEQTTRQIYLDLEITFFLTEVTENFNCIESIY